MGKYGMRQVQPPQRPWKVHPIWRGIGCLMVLIGPVIAFAGAHLLVGMNIERGWYPLPGEMLMTRTLRVPQEITTLLNLQPTSYPLPHLYADLLLTGILLLLGFGAMMVFYAIMYSIMGPSRYGPMDAPPIRRSDVRRRR